MRNEKYYGVFDYGDELKPGSELKIEHTVVQDYYDNQIDLVPFIGLGSKSISKARDQSVEAEKVIFSKIKDSICEWERQAAITKTYDRALEYLNTHAVAHTSNQWIHENYHDRDMISNMVYEMTVSVWEETKYDRAKQESVPVAWYVTWDVDMRSPKHGCCVEIAGQRRKRYTDKAAAEKYIEGRKKAFAQYFKEISPPIPQNYAEYFKVNGVLLPGYTVEGQAPVPSNKTADEIINEIKGGDCLSNEKKPSVLKKLTEGKTNNSPPTKGAQRKEEQSK